MSFTRDARLLTEGAITVKGRLPWSTNVTLLVELTLEGETGRAVYKPRRGERRLWDFQPGLYKREIAAYELSEALGWGLVPLTVARDDGPYGVGSLQHFVAADFEQHYFTLRERPEHLERLRRICLFDVIANNADRKSGHCLLGADGTIWAIDNGLCFHVDDKLRTVIWEFAGEPIREPLCHDLRRLLDTCGPDALAGLIDDDEREALLLRASTLLDEGVFPADGSDYRYPWPPV